LIPQPPPRGEPALAGMPAPPVHVPPRPDEPTSPGAGPQGLPAVDWSFPRALLVGLVTNLLLAQVVVGGIAFIALGITDVDDPKTIYAGLIGDVAWLGFMIIWLVRWHPDWRARIGVFGGRRGVRDALAGLVGGVLLYPGIVIVGLVLTALFEAVSGRPTTTPDQLPQHLNTPEAIASVILAVFVAPVAEELFFRGILFRSIRDRRGFWLGALVSGLIFGLAHYEAAAWQDTVLLQSIMVFTGVALAYLYERRGNLLANVTAHMVFNVVGVFLILSAR
jgi:membrane protease YdiL (CAAX protease family)